MTGISNNDREVEKRTAQEIVDIIRALSYSNEFKEFRKNTDTRGLIGRIITTIESKYDLK